MSNRESLAGQPGHLQYRFGDFLFDPEGGFLRRDGQEVPLRPKAFEVLKYLVLEHGRLVPKDTLVNAVWPDAAVTDNSLAQCLVEVRRAIADDGQTMIRTVARRGYVFAGPVSVVVAAPPPHVAPHPLTPVAHPTPTAASALSPGAAPAPRRAAAWGPWLTASLGLLALAGIGAAVTFVATGPSASSPEREVQITDFNDSVVSPSLSHDGRLLAFMRGGFFGTTASDAQLYVKVLPNGPLVQLTRDEVTKDHPAFSPDDARIVYTTLRPPLRWDSWQVPVLGGSPTPFLPNASGVVWLDGSRIAYSTITAGVHMGVAISTESRNGYKEIYFPERHDGMVHRTAPSPDGAWLLLVEMTGGTWQPCRLVPADGSSTGHQVGPPNGQCTSAAWSPDGHWMYFSSNVGGAYHVWRQRYPDGPYEQITFGPTEQEGTAITPDGKYLITSMGLQQSSLWLHDARGARKLTDERYASQPTVTASGDRLLYLARTFLSRGQESGELWSVEIDSGVRQRLLPGLTMTNYALSHDGTEVVFGSAGMEGGDGVWIADLERRRPPRQLARGSDLRAFFGAPGEIVFAGDDGYLHRVRTDGTGLEKAASERVDFLSAVSPDGRWAVAIVPKQGSDSGTRLRFVSLGGETSFDVCNDECEAGPRSFLVVPPFAWSVDGRSMFVNLVHAPQGRERTVVLPYRPDAPAQENWPAGLRLDGNLTSVAGARIIEAGYTFPARGADTYLSRDWSMQSNLYRVRIPGR